jgi:hypothetical protein
VAWRLSAADYPSIRAAIDISLSEGSLPDTIISLPIYSGYAEQQVLAVVPDADTADTDRQAHLHNAAMLFAAAALCLAIPSFTREAGPEFNASIDRVKPAELAADLRLRAASELEAGSPGAAAQLVPLTFTVAKGSRGQW